MVSIARIKIGKRVRKDFSHVPELASKIEKRGLLQPIAISPDFRLLFGESRLRACKSLGHKTILARILDTDSPKAVEREENEERKDFTLSERVNAAVGYLKEIGNRRGRRTDLGHRADSPLVRAGESTRDSAAREAGFPSTTLFRDAKKVVESKNATLIEWMDAEKLAPSTCAVVAKLSQTKQRAIVGEGPEWARHWVSENRDKAKRFATDDEVKRPLFPDIEARDRAEWNAADPRRSPAEQAKDRFNGMGKIVRAIGNGNLGRDLDWLVRKPKSLKALDLIDFADSCRGAAKKLSAVAERLSLPD